MSIASRITAMEEHIGDIYDTLELGGADLANVNKNIVNIDAQLKNRYLDYLNNGTDEIWNNWEKVTATNVNAATLNNTVEAPMKIDLKGNTFQNGEPTPEVPIPIQNVSGENNIKIENKNIFGVSFQRGYWNTNGTYNEQSSTTTTMSTPKFTLKAGTYFVSNSKITTWQWYILKWSGNSWTATQKNAPSSFTLNEDTLISFQFNGPKGNGVAVEPYLEELTEYMMLEQGSTATTYTAHQEQNLPFSLKSKNLFDKNTMSEHIYRFIPDINTWTPAADSYSIKIPCEPNKTYTISHNTSDTTFFRCGYVTATDEEINSNSTITLYDGYRGGTVKSHTVTTGEGATYLVFQSNGNMMPYIKETLQVEEGSTPTTYEPYYEYELCKIDTAQDYFYKENGKWFLHKEIGKTVFDENTTYTYFSAGSSDTTNAYMLKSIVDIKPYTLYTQAPEMKNTKFSAVPQSASWNPGDFTRLRNNPKVIIFLIEKSQTADDLKNILNGEPLYYVLETPTNTEITDATLISQLEALLQAKSYDDQTNISQTNDDLPFILDITALKNI